MKKPPTEGKSDKAQEQSAAEKDGRIGSRRSALKVLTASGVVAGASIPSRWKKPVIESVVLPSHAQTTGPQTTEPRGCGNGNCNAGSATILAAEVLGNGDLFVLGEYDAPPSCLVVTQVTEVATESQSLLCEVITAGTTLGSEDRSTVGNCDGTSAIADGCLISCSVVIDAASHGVSAGDCVTLRFTFGGSCVCSVVSTVSGA